MAIEEPSEVEADSASTDVTDGAEERDSTDDTGGRESTDDPAREDVSPDDGKPAAIGVKMGSTRTVLARRNGSGVSTVTALTCLATYEDALTGDERVIYGEPAAVEYPDRVRYMLRSGLPEDDENAELAGTFFSEFVEANDVSGDSVVVYAIPTIENEAGLRNLERVVTGSRIGSAHTRSYPEMLCAAIPAMGDGMKAVEEIFVAVNLGSTNLEACAFRRGEQLSRFATGAVTGNEVDRTIANYVEDETQGRVNIDLTTAREYKEEHASFVDFQPFTDVIQQPGGGSHEFTIEHAVMDAVDEYVDALVEEFANTFLPRLANDYMKTYNLALDNGIVLTGGMTCIPGLTEEVEKRLSEALDREVSVVAPDEPVTAAATGAQRIADRLVENDAY
jgi:actin-like ATPase involved in cell morphogenesis